jgi:hypothetical protein
VCVIDWLVGWGKGGRLGCPSCVLSLCALILTSEIRHSTVGHPPTSTPTHKQDGPERVPARTRRHHGAGPLPDPGA